MRKGWLKGAVLAVAAGCLAFCFVPVEAGEKQDTPGQVYIESVDVTGMTKEDIEAAISDRMEERMQEYSLFYVGNQSTKVSMEDLGLYCRNTDVAETAVNVQYQGNILKQYKMQKYGSDTPVILPLYYGVDKEKVRKVIEEQCVPLNHEGTPVGLIHQADGSFQVTEGTEGAAVKVEESVEKVVDYFENSWYGGVGSVRLDVTLSGPTGDAAEMEKLRKELEGIQDVLGTATTEYAKSSKSRKQNIANGVAKVSGAVIYPGEEFSAHAYLLPLNADNGYEQAPSYAAGKVVESYGGGVCQTTTTLYQAALEAELEITERYNHSMLVTYAKPGMDAAITESGKDLKFVNNTGSPIYIEGSADGTSLTYTIYGKEYRASDRSVEYESEVIAKAEPDGVKLEENKEKKAGYLRLLQAEHIGYSAKLWKNVTVNGETKKELINTSHYIKVPAIYEVGTMTDDADLKSRLKAAIKANDLAAVQKIK